MKKISTLLVLTTIAATTAIPSFASADRWHDRHAYKEQWKDLAIVGGAVGLLGIATHNPTVAAVGLGGALYGGVRYSDEDRRYGYDRFDHRRWDDRRWEDRRRDDRRDRDRDRRGDRYGR